MKIKLITPSELKKIKDGTELYCIFGSKVIKGKDHIDNDTRGGFLAYGFKRPDSSKDFNWDTEK